MRDPDPGGRQAGGVPLRYPAACRLDCRDLMHGVEVPDPYRYLEDDAEPATRSWLEQQREAARSWLDSVPGRAEVTELIAEIGALEWRSAPTCRGQRLFFNRQRAGEDHASLVVRDQPNETDRVLIDLADAVDTTLGSWSVSPDGLTVAYVLHRGGTERGDLRLLSVLTGDDLGPQVPDMRTAAVAWCPQGGLLYARAQATRDSGRGLFYCDVTGAREALVWSPVTDDAPFFITPEFSPDGRWLTLVARRGADPRAGLWAVAWNGPPPAPFEPVRFLAPGAARLTTRFGRDGRVYAMTTFGASRGRLCAFEPAQDSDPGRWQPVLAEDPDAPLTRPRSH